MHVPLVDRAGEALHDAAASIPGATALPADVADRAGIVELAQTVLERHGSVSVRMNNAGIGSGGDAA